VHLSLLIPLFENLGLGSFTFNISFFHKVLYNIQQLILYSLELNFLNDTFSPIYRNKYNKFEKYLKLKNCLTTKTLTLNSITVSLL